MSKKPDTTEIRTDLLRRWTMDMLEGQRSEGTHELLCIGIDAVYGPFDINEAKAIAAMRMGPRRTQPQVWRDLAVQRSRLGDHPNRTRPRRLPVSHTRETLRQIALSVGIDRR